MTSVKQNVAHVLLAPITTEKSTTMAEKENSVAFWVNPNATKTQIKKAVETFFKDVKVKSVRTQVARRDYVRFREVNGRRKTRKKAYVKLEAGHEINFAEMANQ